MWKGKMFSGTQRSAVCKRKMFYTSALDFVAGNTVLNVLFEFKQAFFSR